MAWVEHVLTHLSAQGHRVTEPRRAILERIVRYTQPFSAEQLYQDLGGEGGPIGRATVYRTVDLLLAENWLARVHWSPSKETTSDDHAYVPVERGHQHQLVDLRRAAFAIRLAQRAARDTALNRVRRSEPHALPDRSNISRSCAKVPRAIALSRAVRCSRRTRVHQLRTHFGASRSPSPRCLGRRAAHG